MKIIQSEDFKNYLNIVFKVLIIIFVSFPILPYAIRSILTILLLFVAIVYHIVNDNKEKIVLKNRKRCLLLISPFLVLLLSLIYSNDFLGGVNDIVKMLSMLVFPIIWILGAKDFINSKIINYITHVFFGSVLVLVLFQLYKCILNYNTLIAPLTSEEIKYNGLSDFSFISEEITRTIKVRRFRKFSSMIIDSHPTYQGLWGVFSIYLMIKESLKKNKVVFRILYISGAFIIFLWILFLSTRAPILSGFIGLVIVILLSSKIKYKITNLLGLILILCFSVMFFKPLNTRLKEFFNTGVKIVNMNNKAADFNSTNVRWGIYFCDFLLAKEQPFLGYGIGDVQDKLTECQTSRLNAKIYSWNKYNSHNQYFNFILSSGIIGLLVFLYVLFKTFKVSILYKNFTYMFFLIIMSLVFMTENVLSRNDGVLFYAYFNTLYFFNLIKNE